MRGLVEDHDVERLGVCRQVLRDRQRAHHDAGRELGHDVRDPPEELAQRHVPRLLVDLARQRAPFRVLAEIGLGRHRGADPRLDDLLGEFADLLVGGDEGLDGGLVLLGEEAAQHLVLVDDGLGDPTRIGIVERTGEFVAA